DGDPQRAFARQTLFTPFTALVNVTGQPAISVPLHRCDDGLPIGVQFIARPFDEATLVRLAAQLEAARPWREQRPAIRAPCRSSASAGDNPCPARLFPGRRTTF